MERHYPAYAFRKQPLASCSLTDMATDISTVPPDLSDVTPQLWVERLARHGQERTVKGPIPLTAPEVSVGRVADIVLDKKDRALSRVALVVLRVGADRWAVECRSATNTVLLQRPDQPDRQTADLGQAPLVVQNGDRVLIWTGADYWALEFQLPLSTAPALRGIATREAPYAYLALDPRQRPFAVALCASRLDPARFPADTTATAELARVLSVDGQPPSKGAVDVRYHRLRTSIERQVHERSVLAGGTGAPLKIRSRAALADLLVSNAIVTRTDLALLYSA